MTDLSDKQKLELVHELLDELEHAPEPMKDGEKVRVPMYAMDAVQKSIHDASQWAMDSNTAHGHRPGYRMSGKLMRGGDADREAIIDAHEQYDREISERYKHTNPEPVINTPAAPIIDDSWDDWDAQNMYDRYDSSISERWKGE